MSTRFAEGTGTSHVGGTEGHVPRSIWALLVPVAAVIAVGSLVPLLIGDSRVLMGVSVLGVAFGCYAIGFNLIFGSTGQLFLCVGALAGIGEVAATTSKRASGYGKAKSRGSMVPLAL